ncbi:MAG: CvpA family protein [Campylobacter sp.]|nr:CvpA family protein [Campylobacter sp.]
MNSIVWFDVIIIGAILILGLKGLINGLIREIFGLIGLIGGLILASRLKDVGGDFIYANIYQIQNQSLLEFVSFISIWIIFWLFCLLIGKFLAKLIGASGLGFLDRIGGFLAGSAKIFLTVAAVLAIISTTNLSDKIEPYFKDSKVYPIFLQTGKWIANMDVKAIKNDVESLVLDKSQEKKSDVLYQIDQNLSDAVKIDQNLSTTIKIDENVSKESK